METYYQFKPGLIKQSALALGFFDGVHPGHQAVIKKAVEDASRLAVPAALVTFKEHPRSLTAGQSPPLLTLVEQRLELFALLGIDAVLVLSFTEDICRLTPRQYVETVLVGALGARSVSVGFNHRFGRNREGDTDLLACLGREFGFTVNVATPVLIEGAEISSSRIRQAVEQGDAEQACLLLGRPYALAGTVARGAGRGQQMGFPTANLQVLACQILPARGVYAGMARLADGSRRQCVINIGYRPTVDAGQHLSVEAHILDFQGQLYGQHLTIEFRQFLRSEIKFAGLDNLKEQISKDCQLARQCLPANYVSASGNILTA